MIHTTIMKHDEEPAYLAIQREEIRKQRCNDCGKRIKPTFKASRDPLDWMFLQCDTCLEDFCPDCCSTNDQGTTICNNCYETSLHQKPAK